METTITAIEMRQKLGEILDRVAQKGDHITITRANKPLVTLIPAHEHQELCGNRKRLKTIDEALADIKRWQKAHPEEVAALVRSNPTETIRKMRDTRWSSSTRR